MKANWLWLTVVSASLAACGGSDGTESTTSTTTTTSSSTESTTETTAETASTGETGTLQIALTDAEEDFLTYQVDVTGVTLTREDGTEVDVLPATTEVDFVQYQSLSELFLVASLPRGTYNSVLVYLDYTDADIVIQDDAGTSYAATALDTDGNVLTALEASIDLADSALTISPREVAGLTLDLDLSASNTILSYDPAEIEVSPLLMVTASQDETREHRARGSLVSVDTSASTVTLNVRPMRKRSGDFGQSTITVTDDTGYELDTVEYSGSEGLAALALMAADTSVIAYGSLDDSGVFTATSILAGTSVDGTGEDQVKGVVTARTDNVITLSGAVVEADQRRSSFSSTMTITLGDSTVVTGVEEGDSTLADISVGQTVLVAGTLSTTDSTVMDASEGYVRLKLNTVTGSVVSTSPLAIDLTRVNSRDVSLFDFTGTSASTDTDADPLAYELQTSTLDVSNLAVGAWVSVSGYPTDFGAAVGDFDVTSINEVSLSTGSSSYSAHWSTSTLTTTPVTITDSALVLDTSEASERFRIHGVSKSVVDGLTVTNIVAAADTGHYAVHTSGVAASVYTSYSDFLVALAEALAGTEPVSKISVLGTYDQTATALTASTIVVRFGESSRGSSVGRGSSSDSSSDNGSGSGSNNSGRGNRR